MTHDPHEIDERRERAGPSDLLIIVLLVLAIGAGGLIYFVLRGRIVSVEIIRNEKTDTASTPLNAAAKKSPFDDEPTASTPVPKTQEVKIEPPSDEQLADAAKIAVLKKLKLAPNADNVAWAEPEFSKNDDGTFSVTGVLTADGLSRKWSCKLRTEIVASKPTLVATDVTVD